MIHAEIERALGIPGLRARMLRHTREAFAMLPPMDRPRILDIGCGSGEATRELARLSGGEVIGIDIDGEALAEFHRRTEGEGTATPVTALNRSIGESGFPGQYFDLLWAEGSLRFVDMGSGLGECRRILKGSGFLVIHETVEWFESHRASLPCSGFRCVDSYLLPPRSWWTEYYAPLETRIRAFRNELGNRPEPPGLSRYEAEVNQVRSAPGRFDTGFYICR